MKRRSIPEVVAIILSGTVPCGAFAQAAVENPDVMRDQKDDLSNALLPPRSDPKSAATRTGGGYERVGAVALALSGTGLSYQETPDGSLAISADAAAGRASPSPVLLAESSGSKESVQAGTSADGADATQLQEIVVRGIARSYLPDDQTSATGLQMRLIETPQSISVITPEMLKVAGANNAYEAANLVPGAEQSGVGLGRGHILIRGQEIGPRINGVSLFTFPDGFAIERTDFVRGPATVLYGDTGDFGGEINSILKKPLKQFRAEVNANAGDFRSRRFEGDLSGPLIEDGRLSFRVLGAYDTTATPVRGLGIDNISRMAFAALSYEFDPATHLSLSYYWDDRTLDPGDEGCPLFVDSHGQLQLPTAIPVSQYYCGGPGAHERISQSFAVATLEHEFSNGWHFKASAASTKASYDFHYMYPFGPVGSGGLGEGDAYLYTYDRTDHSAELTFNTSLNGNFDLFSRTHKFSLGIEVNDTPGHNRSTFLQSLGIGIISVTDGSLTTFADGSPIPNTDRSTLPVASDRINSSTNYKFSAQTLLNPIDNFDVLAGVLVQHSDLFQQRLIPSNEPVKTTLTQVIPRLGLTYKVAGGGPTLDDSRVYFSFSKGFKPNIGAFGQNGEALTAPQHLTQYEVGWKSQFFKGLVSTNISAYSSKITNIVQAVFTQGGFNQGYSTLTGLNEFRGIEAEVLGEILPGWNVAFNYAYTKTHLQDESFPGLDLQVRSVPRNAATLFSTYEFLRGPLQKLRLGGGIIYKSDYPFIDVSPHEVKTYGQLVASGYTRVDFDVSYAGFKSLNGLELYAHLENAFDANYYLDLYGYASLGITHCPPRTLTVGIRYTFDPTKSAAGKVFGSASK